MRKYVFAVFGIVNLISSCNKGEPPSQSGQGNTPVITSISPMSGGYTTIVTIAGKNFSTDPTKDTVRFNGHVASIVSAKTDTLIVSVPISAGTGAVTVTVGSRTTTGAFFNYLTSYVVTTFAGTGVQGHRDGPADIAQFDLPDGIAIDGQNNLFVADLKCIRKITPDGTVSTLAGSGLLGYLDGPGDTAKFAYDMGIAADAHDNVYVADRGNSCIRKITPDGMVTTFAGSNTYGYLDGTGSNAKFWYPWDLAFDCKVTYMLLNKVISALGKLRPPELFQHWRAMEHGDIWMDRL